MEFYPSNRQREIDKQHDSTFHILNLLDWVGFCHRHGYQTSWRLLGTLYFRENRRKQKNDKENQLKSRSQFITKEHYHWNETIVLHFEMICMIFGWERNGNISMRIPSTVLKTPFVGGSYMYIVFSFFGFLFRIQSNEKCARKMNWNWAVMRRRCCVSNVKILNE